MYWKRLLESESHVSGAERKSPLAEMYERLSSVPLSRADRSQVRSLVSSLLFKSPHPPADALYRCISNGKLVDLDLRGVSLRELLERELLPDNKLQIANCVLDEMSFDFTRVMFETLRAERDVKKVSVEFSSCVMAFRDEVADRTLGFQASFSGCLFCTIAAIQAEESAELSVQLRTGPSFRFEGIKFGRCVFWGVSIPSCSRFLFEECFFIDCEFLRSLSMGAFGGVDGRPGTVFKKTMWIDCEVGKIEVYRVKFSGLHTQCIRFHRECRFFECSFSDVHLSRLDFAAISEDGGLTIRQLKEINLRHDLAELRKEFSGFLSVLHLCLICLFVLPYVFFVFGRVMADRSQELGGIYGRVTELAVRADGVVRKVEKLSEESERVVQRVRELSVAAAGVVKGQSANRAEAAEQLQSSSDGSKGLDPLVGTESQGAEPVIVASDSFITSPSDRTITAAWHLPLYQQLCYFMVSGGDSNSTFKPQWWAVGCFTFFGVYNGLRGWILWKTKRLEHEETVTGLPSDFSFDSSPGTYWIFWIIRVMFWFGLIATMGNLWIYFRQPFPV